MKIQHLTYCYTICEIAGETEFRLYMMGKYSVILYIYPGSIRYIKYDNRREAHTDLIKKLRLLEPRFDIKYTERGLEFIKGNIYLN